MNVTRQQQLSSLKAEYYSNFVDESVWDEEKYYLDEYEDAFCGEREDHDEYEEEVC